MTDFESVGKFHEKFGLPTSTDGPPHELDQQATAFRLRFMLEELKEYADAVGFEIDATILPREADFRTGPLPHDLARAFDGLIDLVYVALGTAHMHRFPWAEGFAEVQRANMGKERCGIGHYFRKASGSIDDSCDIPNCGKPRSAHSFRGSALDVIKPDGWTPPDIFSILAKAAGLK